MLLIIITTKTTITIIVTIVLVVIILIIRMHCELLQLAHKGQSPHARHSLNLSVSFVGSVAASVSNTTKAALTVKMNVLLVRGLKLLFWPTTLCDNNLIATLGVRLHFYHLGPCYCFLTKYRECHCPINLNPRPQSPPYI